MFRAWKIGRIFGVDTCLHWSFILIPLFFLYNDRKFGFYPAVLSAVASLFMLLFVLLHEFGHVLAARLFGIPTQSVTLYPIGGIALMKRQAHNPIEEIVIAIAGPAVNLFLAIGLSLISLAFSIPYGGLESIQVIHSFGDFYHRLIVFNIGLLIFNMLPAFPMDGGRVLRAFFWFFTDLLNATRWATYVAIPFAVLMGVMALASHNYLLLLIAPLVILFGRFELLGLRMQMEARQRREELRSGEFTRVYHFPANVSGWERRFSLPEADFDGYTWDPDAHGWVEWRGGRPVRFYGMHLY